MTATDCDLLLKRVLDQPDDDTVRLVYADALEERGEGSDAIHAELIRTSIDLHRHQPDFKLDWNMNAKVYDESADDRIRRVAHLVRTLYRLHPNYCAAPNYVWAYLTAIWQRGFISEWKGPLQEWAQIGDSLTSLHPIQTVEFTPYFPGDLLTYHIWQHSQRSLSKPFKRQAIWKVKGKPEVVYEDNSKQPVDADQMWRDDRLFREEVEARTKTVLAGWWPRVREWKW